MTRKASSKRHPILIIDDEADFALILKLQLNDAGYEPIRAKNSSEFYELLNQYQFALALIDINMPEISGLELLDFIVKNHPDIPAIMLTAHGSEEIAITAMKRGAMDYLSKPFSTDDMLSKVNQVITTNRLTIRNRRLANERDKEFLRAQAELVRLQNEVASLRQNSGDENPIVKSIEFDEEAYQAGVSILSYFSTIVKQKYPKTKVKVRIEQEHRTVRLIVQTPDGEKEKVERTLEEYGLVVIGQMQPEDLLPNKLQEMQLRHKLDLATIEVSHTKNLLAYQSESHKKEIEQIKGEVAFLKEQIYEAFKRESHARGILLKIIESHAVEGDAKSAVIKLSETIEGEIIEKDKEIIFELLSIIQAKNPPAFEAVKNYLIASFGGATGNLLASWLPMFFATLSR